MTQSLSSSSSANCEPTLPRATPFASLRRALYLSRSKLMGVVGVTDFNRRDIDKPVKERTVIRPFHD